MKCAKHNVTTLTDDEVVRDWHSVWWIIMIASSNGNIFRVTGPLCGEFTGEFPAQKPGTRSFEVFFDLHLNKRLTKQLKRRWFETTSRSLWRHCNEYKAPHNDQIVFRKQLANIIDLDSSHKGPVSQGFDVFFEVSLNRLLNKQFSCRWLRHYDAHMAWM